MRAFEDRRGAEKTPEYIVQWQLRAFEGVSAIRDARCKLDTLQSSAYLSVLALYLDCCLMLINAHALRDLIACNMIETSTSSVRICEQTVEVGLRLMSLILFDDLLQTLRTGTHNTLCVMICHAAAEMTRVRTISPWT